MPKLKVKSAAKKRFMKTAGGVKRGKAEHRHILTKKSPKRKRNFCKMGFIKKCDSKSVARLLKTES